MTSWISSIVLGIRIYMVIAGVFCVPCEGIKVMITKKFNPLRFVISQLFILYMVCVFTLVFFPLPSLAQIANLTYNLQKIPFFFVSDIIKNFSFETVFQVLFNIALTVPFGMVLRYVGGMTVRKATIITLFLSIIIEVGQLTGLFFIYPGSYRVCDVDDLILNTLGGFLGSVLAAKLEGILPVLCSYEMDLRRTRIMANKKIFQV